MGRMAHSISCTLSSKFIQMHERRKRPGAEFTVRKKHIPAPASKCIFDGVDLSGVG